MFTVLLPICIGINAFWSAPQGLECIQQFLGTIRQVSDIDRFAVITGDESIRSLAQRHNMEPVQITFPKSNDHPYTFEQTRSLGRNFQNCCSNQKDALVIVDHRNLFLTADDICRAITAYRENTEACVISLAFCKDYPCQYRSYVTFLDCGIIRFNKPKSPDSPENDQRSDFVIKIDCLLREHGNLTLAVHREAAGYRLHFRCQDLSQEGFFAQILPFTTDGPLYQHSVELHVASPIYEALLYVDGAQLSGLVYILTMNSQAGAYDAAEIFTPMDAPWQLGGAGSTVISKHSDEPMYGRQQFPPLYTYDGSLCILGAKHLAANTIIEPTPVILNDSCIVTDWVDYLYTIVGIEDNPSKQNR